jgi:two-component system, NarL family, response regulator DesR
MPDMTDCPDSKMPEKPGSAATPALRVGIAENNSDLATTLELLIDLQPDLRCAGRCSARSGLLDLAASGIDVLLMDLSLDDGSAVPLLSQLRAAHPSVAVVVYTGHADERVAELCITAGADRVIVKSGPVEPLLEALRAAVHTRRGPLAPAATAGAARAPDAGQPLRK